MKKAKVKARKYWRGRNTCLLYPKKESAVYYAGFGPYAVNSVYVLPADAESIERMVEQINHGIMSLSDGRDHYTSRDLARAALAAIGIKTKGTK
jgi:hypothetical protein